MRAGRLGERQFLAHDRAQRAIFEPRNESGVDVRLFGGCKSQSVNARIEARRIISSRAH